MKCPECNKTTPERTGECLACGASLTADEPPAAPLYELVGILDDDEADRLRERSGEFREEFEERVEQNTPDSHDDDSTVGTEATATSGLATEDTADTPSAKERDFDADLPAISIGDSPFFPADTASIIKGLHPQIEFSLLLTAGSYETLRRADFEDGVVCEATDTDGRRFRAELTSPRPPEIVEKHHPAGLEVEFVFESYPDGSLEIEPIPESSV